MIILHMLNPGTLAELLTLEAERHRGRPGEDEREREAEPVVPLLLEPARGDNG